MKIIFVLFSAADAQHYLSAISLLFPLLPPSLPLQKHICVPPQAIEWIRDSDAIFIHAGAGLSADAVRLDLGFPLDYNAKELF